MTTPNIEALGPAERILQTLMSFTDHAVHGRPGVVYPYTGSAIGVRWEYVTHAVEGDKKVVYRLSKVGKKTTKTKIGTLRADNKVTADNGQVICEYREPGLFPEVVAWIYRQIADVYKLDNEFAARWASYAFGQENRDLKAILAAFMLVQARKGDPVREDGKILFHDDNFRDVAEAMILIRKKSDAKGADKDKDLNPKLLLRIYEILSLPQVVEINRELGFTQSARNPFYGRWEKAVTRWLSFREQNPKMLDGLVKAGYRTTVKALCQKVGYKPTSPEFFAKLRWKQSQAKDGRRTLAIGEAVSAAESWAGFSEAKVCEAITKSGMDWKRITGLLPKEIGITRAVMVAAIEAGALSDRDILIYTPTFEELGILDIPSVKTRFEKAAKAVDDTRAANIAKNVKSKELREKLETIAETVVQKKIEEVTRNIRVYFMIDISGSMQGAIEEAKVCLEKLLHAFPQDRIHIATFNTIGKEIVLKHASGAGVKAAFAGVSAGGGTDYGQGVKVLSKYKPSADEDALFFFVGDEEAGTFTAAVQASGIIPTAFGLLKVLPNSGAPAWRATTYGVDNNVAVRQTAAQLGIPCFQISPDTFKDVYAITRNLRDLIASTPVGVAQVKAVPRYTLVQQILATPLLQKPVWAQ